MHTVPKKSIFVTDTNCQNDKGGNIKNIENVKVMNKCNSNAGILVKKRKVEQWKNHQNEKQNLENRNEWKGQVLESKLDLR